jgi:hypothetical protein
MYQNQNPDIAEIEPTVDIFDNDSGIVCLGVNTNNNQETWVNGTILARKEGPPPQDLYIVWQSTCRRQGKYHICHAPNPSQQGRGFEEFGNGIACYITPCRGIDPNNVRWIDRVTKLWVTPTKKPPSLPDLNNLKEHEPQGGGDICVDKNYAWFFSPTI